jgi:hypothetical protein
VTNQIEQLQAVANQLQGAVDYAQRVLGQISGVVIVPEPTVTSEEQVKEIVEETTQTNSDLISLVSDVTQARIDRMSGEYRQRIESIEKVNVAFELVLAEYFSNDEVDMIMNKLNFCRRISDFNYMRSIYDMYNDSPDNRELMRAICAMYRLNVKNYIDDSTESARYQDRSIVKYATSCPDCGDIAKALVNDLLSAGLTK